MKKIIRLTESDLTRIVRMVINEQSNSVQSYLQKNGWKENPSEPGTYKKSKMSNVKYYCIIKPNKQPKSLDCVLPTDSFPKEQKFDSQLELGKDLFRTFYTDDQKLMVALTNLDQNLLIK